MSDKPNDALLHAGRGLALALQGLCVLAGGVVLLLVPTVLLASQDMTVGPIDIRDLPIVEASPLSVVGILVMLCAIVAALFVFFGKMRALIASVGAGDPFIPANARRLGAMAWLLLAVQALAVMVGLLRFRLANLVAEPGDSPVGFDFNLYDLEGIVMVLVLFVLARIFRTGAVMREDLEGTV